MLRERPELQDITSSVAWQMTEQEVAIAIGEVVPSIVITSRAPLEGGMTLLNQSPRRKTGLVGRCGRPSRRVRRARGNTAEISGRTHPTRPLAVRRRGLVSRRVKNV